MTLSFSYPSPYPSLIPYFPLLPRLILPFLPASILFIPFLLRKDVQFLQPPFLLLFT